MDEDLLAGLKSSVAVLAATIEAQITGDTSLIESTKKRIEEEDRARQTAEANNRAIDKERKTRLAHVAALEEDDKRRREQIDKSKEAVKRLYNEVLKIGDAGVKFASTIGTTATRGVQLELKNRAAVAAQLFRLDLDRVVSAQQIQAAQKALTDSFISTAQGMQVSAVGARQFAQSLKGGFKSEFELTGQSLRALVTAGASTEKQFDSFRKASGRAGLSSDQFATLVNKNSLSFMLYGQKFAKAAVDAERLGISLSSVQSAQESMVTNLDGTIDTIAQINQLGGQIDFGSLTRINEFEGPEATLKYLQATIPPALFQSASTRALLKGFGIPIEDLMKSANSTQASAADQIEKAMTESADATGIFTKAIGLLSTVTSRVTMILNGSFFTLALAAGYAAKQLFGVKGAGISEILKDFTTNMSAGMKTVMGAAGVVGVAASMYGAREAKKAGQSILPSIISGMLSGATTGAVIGGPWGALGGALIGGGATAFAGMANGGLVRGPGTATSDSILTPLSDGEFVINAASTKNLGTDFLGALNSGMDVTRSINATFNTARKFSRFLAKSNSARSLQGIPVIGSVLSGILSGVAEYGKNGNLVQAFGKGAFSAGGNLLGYAGVAAGTMGNPIAAALGGIGGSRLGETAFDKLFSANTASKTSTAPSDMGTVSRLTNKIDDFINTLNDATTNIDMNGMVQQVPRMRLAGVRSRYEVG